MKPRTLVALSLAALAGCHDKSPETLPAATAASASAAPAPSPAAIEASAAAVPGRLASKALALPGATGPAFIDYIVYEPVRSRVWVPVGSTGSVDVLDVATGAFTRVDGFKTTSREVRGKKRTIGPSAAAAGDGFVYVGNRATSEVCPIDAETLKAAKCVTIPKGIDGVAYVASAKEVWVTAPDDKTLFVLDASKPPSLQRKTSIVLAGEPEGYAVDEARGLFFTNLEDAGATVVIDVKTHAVKATLNPGCGADGPRGLAIDSAHQLALVACTDHVQALDLAKGGAMLGKLESGAGVDNVDLLGGKLYVAAGKASRITVATFDGEGIFSVSATGDSAPGARNAVADALGNVYVADSLGARLLVFSAPGR